MSRHIVVILLVYWGHIVCTCVFTWVNRWHMRSVYWRHILCIYLSTNKNVCVAYIGDIYVFIYHCKYETYALRILVAYTCVLTLVNRWHICVTYIGDIYAHIVNMYAYIYFMYVYKSSLMNEYILIQETHYTIPLKFINYKRCNSASTYYDQKYRKLELINRMSMWPHPSSLGTHVMYIQLHIVCLYVTCYLIRL